MRIGVISDVHANFEALTSVFEAIQKEGVDMILNSGDSIGFSAFPNECVSLIADNDVVSVIGNYDDAGASIPFCSRCWGGSKVSKEGDRIRAASLKWTQENVSDETRKYLSLLPIRHEIETASGKIIMFHGGPENLIQWIGPDDCGELTSVLDGGSVKLVIMGHTHKPFSRRINGTLFVNPGSVGRPFGGDPRASFAIIDLADEISVGFRRIEYDIEKNIKALIAAGLPSEIGTMLREGRNISF